METKTFIAVKAPDIFYFIESPVEGKSNLPGSMDYKFYSLETFITRLIEKFPGTIRDLGGVTNIQPEFLFRFSKNSIAPTTACFTKIVEFNSVRELIKLYYKYVIATTLFD